MRESKETTKVKSLCQQLFFSFFLHSIPIRRGRVGLLCALLLVWLVVRRTAPSLASTPVCRPAHRLLRLAAGVNTAHYLTESITYSSSDKAIIVRDAGLGLCFMLASLVLPVPVPSRTTISAAASRTLH